MPENQHPSVIKSLCEQLCQIFHLTNGSLEIHYHEGEPRQIDVDAVRLSDDGLEVITHDKGFKFDRRRRD